MGENRRKTWKINTFHFYIYIHFDTIVTVYIYDINRIYVCIPTNYKLLSYTRYTRGTKALPGLIFPILDFQFFINKNIFNLNVVSSSARQTHFFFVQPSPPDESQSTNLWN